MINRTISRASVALFSVVYVLAISAVSGADDERDEHDDEGTALVLDEIEREEAGIQTAIIKRAAVAKQLRLPGEVKLNAYKSAKVAPRITAQVVKRHVYLGDRVEVDQALVTLSSIEMADAQGELLVADQEWQRVEALGVDVVSARRYTEAQVGRQRAVAKVLAYGLTESQVRKLAASGDASRAKGEFDIYAPIAGTVLEDEFVLGELIDPGRVIFEISDETSLWVEARTSAGAINSVKEGMDVRISPDQQNWGSGKVIQIHHRLEESTRTQGIRVEFTNDDDWLHPGEFVEVEIAAGDQSEVLAVPTAAVVLLEGNSVVFRLEDGNEFHPQVVVTGGTYGKSIEIQRGLDDGDVIATTGVFYLKSLLLKSSIGEGHAH